MRISSNSPSRTAIHFKQRLFVSRSLVIGVLLELKMHSQRDSRHETMLFRFSVTQHSYVYQYWETQLRMRNMLSSDVVYGPQYMVTSNKSHKIRTSNKTILR